jgi:hypothetical protein
MLDSLAAIGNDVMLNAALCVDRMRSTFGSLTSIGVTEMCLFTHVEPKARKLSLAPKYRIAVGYFFSEGVQLR